MGPTDMGRRGYPRRLAGAVAVAASASLATLVLLLAVAPSRETMLTTAIASVAKPDGSIVVDDGKGKGDRRRRLAHLAPPPPQTSLAVAILDSSAGCTDGRYNPPSITIRSNTVVTWNNSSGEAHTATSNQGVFDAGNIARGATSKGVTFSRPATHAYHCIYHSCMTATVIVT